MLFVVSANMSAFALSIRSFGVGVGAGVFEVVGEGVFEVVGAGVFEVVGAGVFGAGFDASHVLGRADWFQKQKLVFLQTFLDIRESPHISAAVLLQILQEAGQPSRAPGFLKHRFFFFPNQLQVFSFPFLFFQTKVGSSSHNGVLVGDAVGAFIGD